MRYRRPIYIAPGSKYAAWKRQAAAAKAALQAHAYSGYRFPPEICGSVRW